MFKVVRKDSLGKECFSLNVERLAGSWQKSAVDLGSEYVVISNTFYMPHIACISWVMPIFFIYMSVFVFYVTFLWVENPKFPRYRREVKASGPFKWG